jgi:type IV secretion system protein VirB9
MKHILLFNFLFLCYAVPVQAATLPQAGSIDARIKTFSYDDHQVYRLTGHYGFSTVIEFSPFETIDSVSLGDSQSWQIEASHKQNILFIKPILQNAHTNMTVLTSLRIYSFDLSAQDLNDEAYEDVTFRVRFAYPQNPAEKNEISQSAEFNPFEDKDSDDFSFQYSYAGSNALKPIRAFDDGTFTYLRFKNFKTMPAVFAVDTKGRESLVNFSIKGKYMVIAGINRQLTLRDGDAATCIFNDVLHEDTKLQKKPAPIDASLTQDLAIPLPPEKPYFLTKNTGGFLGAIKSVFKGDDLQSNAAQETNK